MDKYLNDLAALALDEWGANAARIVDGTVEAIMPGGYRLRIEVRSD